MTHDLRRLVYFFEAHVSSNLGLDIVFTLPNRILTLH